MASAAVIAAHQRLAEAVVGLAAAMGSDEDNLDLLRLVHGGVRKLVGLEVELLGGLERRGAFVERGYKNTPHALGDMLGMERFEARQLVNTADHVRPRVGFDGAGLPPRLPATAVVFAAGQTTVRHVDAIVRVLTSAAAERITPQEWAGVETELADQASIYTPKELHAHGKALVDMLDQDGAEPDDKPRDETNEVHLFPSPDGTGGTIKGTFESAELFEAVTTAIGALSKPADADDRRSIGARQAEALADLCSFALTHQKLPDAGGFRPTITAIVHLDDLHNWLRNGSVPFAGSLTPQALRMLACDAAIIPIVMNGEGQPLDVGRQQRTIPHGIRAAIAARDHGCAWPDCTAPVSWSECHHIAHWEHGGHTKIDNLVMLCRHHHRVIHDSDWIVRIRDGLPEFVPPTWIDPDQVPRRKPHPHLYVVSDRPPGSRWRRRRTATVRTPR